MHAVYLYLVITKPQDDPDKKINYVKTRITK